LASWSLKIFSITESSVLVVSKPANALQSFTTKPPPITSEPRLTVPAYTSTRTYQGKIFSFFLLKKNTAKTEKNNSFNNDKIIITLIMKKNIL
jgi:hypothetical protein